MSLSFTVHGVPAPQGSKRFVGMGGGRGRMVESSKAVGPWREAVRAECQRAIEAGQEPVMDGPVQLMATFFLLRPKGHYGTGRNAGKVRESAPRHPAGKPDLDKLLRSLLDGLTAAGVWRDDAQVVTVDVQKLYATAVIPPGVLVRVMAS